jgi:dynein heavy chain
MSKRSPLLLDPHLQASAWIRLKEKMSPLFVACQDQSDLMSIVEQALEGGASLLIEHITEATLNPILWPIIRRATTIKGRTTYLKLNDKMLEWHPTFRLYLHTTMSNPHFPPEVQAETTMIHFSVTPHGLKDQLLALIVRKVQRLYCHHTLTRMIDMA